MVPNAGNAAPHIEAGTDVLGAIFHASFWLMLVFIA